MRAASLVAYKFLWQPTTAEYFGNTILLISYTELHIYPFRMPPKKAKGADDGATGKVCKHKSLSKLEKV